MAFRQTKAVLIRHQRAMAKHRWPEAQCAIQQELSRRRNEKISATNNLADLHGRVIHNHSELIGGHVIVAPDHKIAKIFSGHKSL